MKTLPFRKNKKGKSFPVSNEKLNLNEMMCIKGGTDPITPPPPPTPRP